MNAPYPNCPPLARRAACWRKPVASTRRSHPLWFGLLRPAPVRATADWSYPLTSFHRAHRLLPGCLACQLFSGSEWSRGIFCWACWTNIRSQAKRTNQTKITYSPSVRYEERYRLWMAPLLAAISESLAPTYPFKEVGLGRSPYQRTGQAVMFKAAPTSQHFVALSSS